ncbi:MAG: hypothetical protein K5868_02010 [Lachnospiraceae bacterium]|nr:hypothetical protein [Lachnospiraceae bacterium]
MSSVIKTGQLNIRNKAIAAVSVTVLAAVLILLCVIPYSTDHQVEEVLPKLGQAPVYEELADGQTFECMYMADRQMSVKSIELLMVNTEGSVGSDGMLTENAGTSGNSGTAENAFGGAYIHIKVVDLLSSDSAPAWEGDVLLSELKAGSWSSVSADFLMHDKHMYSFEFTPVGCEPYFMKVDAYEPGISMGFKIQSDRRITLAYKFSCLIPVVIVVAFATVLILLLGNTKAGKIFNVLFLLLLFVSLSFKIYKTAYVDGIYISADSDGYLREAVNLVAGNGFSYEGLAGYKSHFANWPIIYPAMIAGMMLVTGANAYLASKYVTFILLVLILLVLYLAFKDKAWIYSLALLNLGFVGIAYHTWSELPFILFMIIFVLCLGKTLSTKNPSTLVYVALGASALATFLTRYFGIFLWFVAGTYWLLLLCMYMRERRSSKTVRYEGTGDEEPEVSQSHAFLFKKIIGMPVSLGVSGILALAYLMMNKIRNGNPTGVARGTWWDDYRTLTIDLINSLVTEVFNVFTVEVPAVIANMNIVIKAGLVLAVVAISIVLVIICLIELPFDKAICLPPMVFVVTATVYYVMFTVIRYCSSMDTFYFRFFAPATVLLVIGLIGLLLGRLGVGTDGEKGAEDMAAVPTTNNLLSVILSAVGVIIAIALLTGLINNGRSIYRERDDKTYYDIVTGVWSEAYSEIPVRSVILWNPMDFRSSWTRPDVYSGELLPDDTWNSLCERYYGSDYICMLRSDAEVVASEGGYDDSVAYKLSEALKISDTGSRYLIMKK